MRSVWSATHTHRQPQPHTRTHPHTRARSSDGNILPAMPGNAQRLFESLRHDYIIEHYTPGPTTFAFLLLWVCSPLTLLYIYSHLPQQHTHTQSRHIKSHLGRMWNYMCFGSLAQKRTRARHRALLHFICIVKCLWWYCRRFDSTHLASLFNKSLSKWSNLLSVWTGSVVTFVSIRSYIISKI